MGELAIKRNLKLQLPSSYMDIEKDEMEYIDGGGTLGDLGTLLQAFVAVGAALMFYGSLSVNKKQAIETKYGVYIVIAAGMITVGAIGYACRKVEGTIWGGVKHIFGY